MTSYIYSIPFCSYCPYIIPRSILSDRFLSEENPCDERHLYLHRVFWTYLMAAEAAYALTKIRDSLAVLKMYYLGRTVSYAVATAYALFLNEVRLGLAFFYKIALEPLRHSS